MMRTLNSPLDDIGVLIWFQEKTKHVDWRLLRRRPTMTFGEIDSVMLREKQRPTWFSSRHIIQKFVVLPIVFKQKCTTLVPERKLDVE